MRAMVARFSTHGKPRRPAALSYVRRSAELGSKVLARSVMWLHIKSAWTGCSAHEVPQQQRRCRNKAGTKPDPEVIKQGHSASDFENQATHQSTPTSWKQWPYCVFHSAVLE